MKVHGVFEFTERFTGQESLHSLHTVGKEILATAVQFVAHLCNEIIVEHVQYQFIRSQAGAHSRYRLQSISTDNAARAFLRILAAIADNALVAIVLPVVCIVSAIQCQARILAVVIVRVVLLLLQLLVIAAVLDVVAVGVGGGIVAIFSLSCFSWIGIAAVQQQLLPRLCVQAIDVSIAAAAATVAQHLLRLNVQKATSDAVTRVYAISNVLDFISAGRKNKHINRICNMQIYNMQFIYFVLYSFTYFTTSSRKVM